MRQASAIMRTWSRRTHGSPRRGAAFSSSKGGRCSSWPRCVPAYPLLRRAPTRRRPSGARPSRASWRATSRRARCAAFCAIAATARTAGSSGATSARRPRPCSGIGRALRRAPRALRPRVSLIGWSLGGIYARELARRFPRSVRQVITLASPFRDVEAINVPRFLRASRAGGRCPSEAALRARARRSPAGAVDGHLQPQRRHRRVAELPRARGRSARASRWRAATSASGTIPSCC